MSNPLILHIDQLSKDFFLHEQEKSIPSAQNISLSVYTGQLTALTGMSGVGKSSILKCVYRTYRPTKGGIDYYTEDGEILDLASISEQEMLQLRRGDISFVTQFLHCLPRQSTLDVVAKPLFDLGIDRATAVDRAQKLLQEVELPEHLWTVSPTTFSGGEKQRVNLSRGIIANPRLLLLDEPTASLDRFSVDRVVQMIQRIKQSGTAILAILHDPDLVAKIADFEVQLSTETPLIAS